MDNPVVLLGTAPAIPPAPPPEINPIIEELTGTDPVVDWILPDRLPRSGLYAWAGSPGCGKSLLSYTMGLALATGLPALGSVPDHPYRILYFDQENSRPDRVQYLRWAWEGLERPDLALIAENMWVASFVLGSDRWVQSAAGLIQRYRPDLFIVDTTTPSCHIEDENDNAEASRAINNIRRLMGLTTPHATAIVLKHAKIRAIDGKYTLRGAKAWEGAVDGVTYITKNVGRPRGDGLFPITMTPDKVRAFGLRHPLLITPNRTDDLKGITLSVQALADHAHEHQNN